MRDWDRTEFEASAVYRSITEAALFCHYGSGEWARVVLLRGEPVAAFGAVGSPYQPQLMSAWAFGTKRFKRTVPAITAEVNSWKPRLIEQGVRRIEARAIVGHDLAGHWMASLGAKREAVLRRYGVNGEDFELWAWIGESDDVYA